MEVQFEGYWVVATGSFSIAEGGVGSDEEYPAFRDGQLLCHLYYE